MYNKKSISYHMSKLVYNQTFLRLYLSLAKLSMIPLYDNW
jgi:hypothetical protein